MSLAHFYCASDSPVSEFPPPPGSPLAVTWSSRGNLGEEPWREDNPAIVGF